MFTIKHLTSTGAESLYPAIEVSYMPAFADQIARGGARDTVWYTDPRTREIKSIEFGTVYVTNETGATVATYRLSDNAVGTVSNSAAA